MTGKIDSRQAIDRLCSAAREIGHTVRFMEVCGTHTVNAFRSGLHSLMPENVVLLSGPGCPVCVTSQGDVDQLIDLALRPGITLCTYGDMLRVTGASGSLEEARARGADVRVVYSALDAVKFAEKNLSAKVVFAAVGFETTAPATAAAVLAAEAKWLGNFTVLTSHKRILPAMRALLDSGKINVDGFLCPGHVSVILGSEAFRPIVNEYRKPCVITGFEGPQIAASLARLTEMVRDGAPALENLYSQAVSDGGNSFALELLDKVFSSADVYWRGLGVLPDSAMVLRPQFRHFDARLRYELGEPTNREPAGCRCGDVITGQATPEDCKLFGTVCTPARAIGPCMVSSEGTCQAWFKYHRRKNTEDRSQKSEIRGLV